MSNAFAPIVRLDLSPSLADLFIVGVAPIDYGPLLLLKPFGFRIAPDTLASNGFRRRLARHYPHLWIRRSSFERRRDLNPPDSCTAQRTLWPHPTSHPRAYSAYGLSPSRAGPAQRVRAWMRPPRFRAKNSPRAQGLRLREVLPMQAIRHGTMLPPLSQNKIGTSELDPFRSSVLRLWSPL